MTNALSFIDVAFARCCCIDRLHILVYDNTAGKKKTKRSKSLQSLTNTSESINASSSSGLDTTIRQHTNKAIVNQSIRLQSAKSYKVENVPNHHFMRSYQYSQGTEGKEHEHSEFHSDFTTIIAQLRSLIAQLHQLRLPKDIIPHHSQTQQGINISSTLRVLL
jgi:hypothetical protein